MSKHWAHTLYIQYIQFLVAIAPKCDIRPNLFAFAYYVYTLHTMTLGAILLFIRSFSLFGCVVKYENWLFAISMTMFLVIPLRCDFLQFWFLLCFTPPPLSLAHALRSFEPFFDCLRCRIWTTVYFSDVCFIPYPPNNRKANRNSIVCIIHQFSNCLNRSTARFFLPVCLSFSLCLRQCVFFSTTMLLYRTFIYWQHLSSG